MRVAVFESASFGCVCAGIANQKDANGNVIYHTPDKMNTDGTTLLDLSKSDIDGGPTKWSNLNNNVPYCAALLVA